MSVADHGNSNGDGNGSVGTVAMDRGDRNGKVKEAMYEQIEEAARMAGEDAWWVTQDWNKRFKNERKRMTVTEYIAKMAKK